MYQAGCRAGLVLVPATWWAHIELVPACCCLNIELAPSRKCVTLMVVPADCRAHLVLLLQRGTHAFLFDHRDIEQDTGWQAFLDFRCSVSVPPLCMKVAQKLSWTACTLTSLKCSCPCSPPAQCQNSLQDCDLQALIEVQPLDSGASAEVHGQVECHSNAANALSLLA